ncbi:MAG: sensor histidine kinase [Janthinobacterium lividum]
MATASPSADLSAMRAQWSSARFALGTAAAAWLLYLAVALVRCIVYGFIHPYMLMARHALTAAVAVAVASLIYLVLRRNESREMRVRLAIALAISMPPAAILSIVNYNVMYVFAPAFYLRDMGMNMHLSLLGEVLHSSIENYFVFAAWGVLYTAVSHAVHTQDVLRRAAASDAAARAAELRALRLQLDPHFLFNALNTVSGLILGGEPRAADRAVEALSSFLRATLEADATADIPLSEELRLQSLYLQIEQVRFGDRLHVEIDVADGLEDALVPALILQPIVENSVRHAVARTSKPVRVRLTAKAAEAMLVLSVENDGPDGPVHAGHGLGLSNVASRLALRYDGCAGVVSGRLADGVYRTEVRLPLATASKHREAS